MVNPLRIYTLKVTNFWWFHLSKSCIISSMLMIVTLQFCLKTKFINCAFECFWSSQSISNRINIVWLKCQYVIPNELFIDAPVVNNGGAIDVKIIFIFLYLVSVFTWNSSMLSTFAENRFPYQYGFNFMILWIVVSRSFYSTFDDYPKHIFGAK